MTDTPKPKRPKIRFKRVAGADHVPPPSPATVRRRAKAAENPPPPKPEKVPAPPKPKREPSPLDIYKKSDTSEIHGVNATAKALVEAMVWEGINRRDAIEKLGISTSYAYRLLRSPDVMAHYQAELDVLRNSGKARLVHRLEELTEQNDNQTAAVGAAKVLLSMDGSGKASVGPTVNVNVLSPGWVIDATAALSGQRQTASLPHRDDNLLIDMHPVPGEARNTSAKPARLPEPPASPPIAASLEGTRAGPGAARGDRHARARPATGGGGGGVRDLRALRDGVGGKNGSPSSTS
jgi:hypothetical protein